MKEELKNLLKKFVADVDEHNRAKHAGEKPDLLFEDDIEITFVNFYKWLNF